MCQHIGLDADQSAQLSAVAVPGLKCKCKKNSNWASIKTEALSSNAYPHQGVLEAYCSEVHVHSHSPRLADHVHKQRFMEHPVRMSKQSIRVLMPVLRCWGQQMCLFVQGRRQSVVTWHCTI